MNGTSSNNKRTASQAALTSIEYRKDGRKRFRGCSKISDYIMMSKLGEGTFGEVHKAESRKTGQIVALKKILMHQEKEGFPLTALREIKLLKMLSHPNVLKLEEIAVEKNREAVGRKKAVIYMVTPYMDHDLSGLLENPAVKFTEAHLKCYMMQLLEGVAYLHSKSILHRDMKAANLLINNEGVLQIADFGLARHYDDPPPQRGKGNGEGTRGYTQVVVTRWYRPPELLLQLRHYTPAIDIWGVGCVFGELFKGHPILPGNSDLQQLRLIFDLVGSPTEENMPGFSSLPGCDGVLTFRECTNKLSREFLSQGDLFKSLMSELLKLDWRKRINAMDALEHPYFKSDPLPAKPREIPTFQESHELDRRKFREQKENPPPAPAGGTVGMGPEGDFTNGYGHGNGMPGGAGFPQDLRAHPPHRNGPDNRHQQQAAEARVPPPPPSTQPPPQRRPAWAQAPPNGLPPRPPPPKDNYGAGGARPYDNNRDRTDRTGHDRGAPRPPRDRDRDRERERERERASGGASQVDTYIPSYSRATEGRGRDEGHRRDDRPRLSEDRRERERDDGARRSRSSTRRSRSPNRDRDRERDRDRDHDRNRDRERDRDRDRDRERDRNRDLYRR